MRADPAAQLRKLTACLSSRNRAGANRVLASLTVSAPVLRQQWRALAALAMNHGEIDLALAATRLLVRDMGDAASALHEQAVLLARVGRLQEATAVLDAIDPEPTAADPTIPDRATLDFTRGTIALDRGDLELARSLLDDVVAARPLAGTAWLARVTAGDMPLAQENRLLALHDHAFATVPAAERVPAFYAAGQVLDRRGAHDRAFACFAAGAAVRCRWLRHDRAADAANAGVATHGTRRAQPMSSKGRAIFVVGLPRSGTTLVEQILTAHSQVVGGGELNLMRLIAQDAGGTNAAAVEAYEAKGGSRAGLSALYHHLLDQRFGSDGRIVDKTLNGSRLLGLIDAVLPDSPIIWIRRDPLDCAWSCFRTHFAVGAPWSLDQRDMAEHMRLEDQLFARWCDLLGARILSVDYAALVDDPEAQIGRILAHCGLPQESGPYAPEDNARAVTTSSVVQVRRPINRSGIGTAGPYEAHLAPFIAAIRER